MSGELIAHRGAQIVTREELKAFAPPPATETFKPIGHAELVATLTQVMQDRGLHIVREQFAVQNQKLFGTFDLEWQKMEEYGAAVGFRHANDKSMPIQIAVGARVFVCDNMSFLGELIHTRKHTAKLDLAWNLTQPCTATCKVGGSSGMISLSRKKRSWRSAKRRPSSTISLRVRLCRYDFFTLSRTIGRPERKLNRRLDGFCTTFAHSNSTLSPQPRSFR